MTEGPLSRVTVLDLTDERGIYGAKLLADLGANVIRPEPLTGDPLRTRGPFIQSTDQEKQSIWHTYFCSSRRSITLDLGSVEGSEQFELLLTKADIVLTCPGAFGVERSKAVSYTHLTLPTILLV